jgi:hypothetical protein
MTINEAKAILKNSGYICEGKMLDTHENFAYLYLLLKMNGAEMKHSLLDCIENWEILIKMNGYPVSITSKNNSKDNVIVSVKTGEEDGDSIDQPFSLHELISYASQNNLNAFKNTIFGYSESDDEYENDSVYGKKANI